MARPALDTEKRTVPGLRFARGVRVKLSANQLMVLRLACTHGRLTHGCVQQSEYGARTCTIYSLRKRGLLDVMDKPTDAGRQLFERHEPPNSNSRTPNVR